MGIFYATREDVKSAGGNDTTRDDSRVDRAIDSASRSIESLTHRRFYPELGTRYFDWPNQQGARSWRLWLDENELIEVTALFSANTQVLDSEFFLEPADSGPPFNRIEMNLGTSGAFSSGDTHQRSIRVDGLFGYNDDEEPAGVLVEALDDSETAVDVSDSAVIGIGNIIRVDDERMIVTGKSMLSTGQTLQADLTASKADKTVGVVTGSEFVVGEQILLNAERMRIEDIAGNNLVVERAVGASVLATHSSSTIYAPRTLQVVRGQLGTDAATHSNSAPIAKHAVPSLVRSLCIAEAIDILSQESSGYAATVGAGGASRDAEGPGISGLREQVYTRYGRKNRMRVIR